jgi:hypothetical protein
MLAHAPAGEVWQVEGNSADGATYPEGIGDAESEGETRKHARILPEMTMRMNGRQAMIDGFVLRCE